MDVFRFVNASHAARFPSFASGKLTGRLRTPRARNVTFKSMSVGLLQHQHPKGSGDCFGPTRLSRT